MLNTEQLKEFVIKPVLNDIKLYSENAVQLLLFTCAVESDGGYYLKQLKGTALGIYQMEPLTYNDIWELYIKANPKILMLISQNFNMTRIPDAELMISDLRYATLMARLFYRRVPELLPDSKDIDGMWEYYKKYYNTPLGKAQKQPCLVKYYKFITP